MLDGHYTIAFDNTHIASNCEQSHTSTRLEFRHCNWFSPSKFMVTDTSKKITFCRITSTKSRGSTFSLKLVQCRAEVTFCSVLCSTKKDPKTKLSPDYAM